MIHVIIAQMINIKVYYEYNNCIRYGTFVTKL